MAARVLCVDGDPERRALFARVARAAGAAPVLVATVAEARRARDEGPLAVVVGGGEAGLAALAELAARRHGAPRIAVAAVDDGAEVAALVARVRPFAVVDARAPDALQLEAQIGAALLEAPGPDGGSGRFAQPFDAPEFARVTVDRASGVLAAAYLRLRLVEEAVRARRYARPLALGLLDIDGLRRVGDEHGPEVSARLVRHVGEVLLRGARTVDLVGRWAAGSYAVVLPETLGDSAWGICERLRAQVAAARFSTGAIVPRLSAGVAVQSHRARDASELVERADAALWRAKREGGDRTLTLDG